MVRIKEFCIKNFEKILVFSLLLLVICMHLFVIQKMAFLNIFFLPVLVSGFILGRKGAMTTSFLSIALVVYLLVVYPGTFEYKELRSSESEIDVALGLIVWGGFLTLAGYMVGTLYEQRERKMHELRKAYMGVLEILTKYLESADRYTKGHSLRVADISTDIASALNLPDQEVEHIRVAALLHDIGKIEISTDIIHKAASLTQDERALIERHCAEGVRIMGTVGVVLKEAIPIVLAHHRYYSDLTDGSNAPDRTIPIGARIIAVSDAYDAMVTDRPYRRGKPAWQALEEIERCSGKQFDPAVVDAFRKLFPRFNEVEEKDMEEPCTWDLEAAVEQAHH